MKITEVRIFPAEGRDGKLKAFATMTFDDWFVVRNVKIIQGTSGLFVAMPSRKPMDTCPKCKFKNARGSRYCNQCGKEQPKQDVSQEEDGKDKKSGYMDIAHPITPECRIYLQKQILESYEREMGGTRTCEKEKEETVVEEQIPVHVDEAPAVERDIEPITENLVLDREKDIEL